MAQKAPNTYAALPRAPRNDQDDFPPHGLDESKFQGVKFVGGVFIRSDYQPISFANKLTAG